MSDIVYTKAAVDAQLAAQAASVAATYVPFWKANTAYAQGATVVNPSGQTVQANSAFTSGPTYNATNWTVVAGGTGGGGAVSSVAGRTGAVTLAKSDVGLPNVDNTADTAKPVSTAQQAALDAKAPLTSPAFTGSPTISGTTVAKTTDITAAVSAVSYPSLPGKPGATARIGTRRVVRLGLFPDSSNAASETQFTAAAGEMPTLILAPYNFLTPLDSTRMQALHARGQTPVIALMPVGATDAPSQPAYSLANITAGNFDTFLTTFFTALKALNFTVYLRFAHEMNGNWYPYSEQVNGNSAGQFAAMWRHVYTVAQTVGATNVKWIFCPTTDYGVPGQAGGSTLISELYPGDAYVDILGLNGYNWGATGPDGWRTPSQVYDTTIADLVAVNGAKPVWICEMGCADDDGGSKATWFGQFATWLLGSRVSQFLYFNATDPSGKNWKVDSTIANAAAFGSAIALLRESSQASGYQLVAGANTTLTTDILNRTLTITATGGSGGVTAAKASGLALVLGS